MRSQVVLLATIGTTIAQFGRVVNRDRWRELLETGPEFHSPDRMMADDSMMADEPFNIGRSDRDRNVGGRDSIDLFDIALGGDKLEKDADPEITHSMNFTDPMDPEYCCDEPKECLCTFGCVDQNYTCPVDVVLAIDVCHCDNRRWIKTIEFIVHLVEELKEKLTDFRFSLILFNDVQESVFTLDEWKAEWTLAQVYDMIDSYDLAGFYGRGTVLHTGLEYAYQQFDHDLKRKGLLILYSNGLSQSEDHEVLDMVAKYPGPDVITVTADSLDPMKCSGVMCPNKELLQDLTTDMLVDGSGRRQFWAAKEVRQYIQNQFICAEQACEMGPCDCDFTCDKAPAKQPEEETCNVCNDIPCPADIVIAVDMCTCDPKRFEQAQAFISELTDRLIPISEEAGQKIRISVVQFNELAVTASHFSEFNGMAAETVDLFKKKVQDMTVDAFRGMGTNLTSGLVKIQEVFIEDGMTQDERDDMGLNTNITEKMVILFSNGNSEDSRLAIMKKIEDIQEDQIHILPLSVSARETNCIVDPMCPDSKFLNKIKDDDLKNYLDSTKVDEAVQMVSEFLSNLYCEDISCYNPCPRETEEAVSIDEEPLVTCTSPFDEVNVVDTHNSAIKPNTCPAMNVAFIIDGSDSITGRPNGGQWKQVKNWVWDVISALDLESRPAISYVSVMQYAYDTEILGKKWWPIGCDPYKITTEDFKQELLEWRQMNTTTNTYKATAKMLESFEDNYVAYLNQNPFSMLVVISDGDHRDVYRRNKAAINDLKDRFDVIQLVTTSGHFQNKEDWEKGTQILSLSDRINWANPEYSFLTECESTCNARNAPMRNAPGESLMMDLDFLDEPV